MQKDLSDNAENHKNWQEPKSQRLTQIPIDMAQILQLQSLSRKTGKKCKDNQRTPMTSNNL